MQISEEIKQKLDELKAEYLSIGYHGPFDGRVLGVFAREMEEKVSEQNNTVAKKLFKIFIELAQNIALYSVDRIISEAGDIGYGIFILKEYSDKYFLIAGNKAKSKDAFLAAEKCDTINSMSREKLREYKRTLRRKPPNDRGGGNIGLIQVALLSNSKLIYDIKNLDENYSFLTLGVSISKNI